MRKQLGPFVGVDNRRHPTDLTITLDRARLDALAAAVNVDLAQGGKIRRRAGFTRLLDQRVHSLWGDGDELGYGVLGTDLVAIDANGFAKVVQGGMPERVPVSFTRRAGVVFWANGLRMGAVIGEQPVQPTPALQNLPTVGVLPDGGLQAGTYQLVFTLSGVLGEGPATHPVAVDVPEQGCIQIMGMVEPEGFVLNTYITAPNGTVFNGVEVARYADQGRIAVLDDAGAQAETIGLVALPVGSVVRSQDARLLSAKENLLFYSEPFAPLLAKPTNYIAFEDRICMVRPCGGGVFVGTTAATYWLAGDLAGADLAQVLPYGALAHSDCVSPRDNDVVFWHSPRGLIRGLGSGAVQAVQQERLALSGGKSAATYVRERNGQTHVIAAVQAPQKTQGAVYASIDAQVIRRSL